MRTATRSFRLVSPRSCRSHSTHASHQHLAPENAAGAVPQNARLRFAPSPTGYLHLGGSRTASFNHLLARKWGGKWLLRIEDTDRSRLVPGSVDALRSALEWAGLDYDEGVGVGGPCGPYTQSERTDSYREHAKELVDNGHAYECFCTPDELAAIRASLRAQGTRQGYDGRCRHSSRDEVRRNKEAGRPYVVRFKMDPKVTSMPADSIFGQGQPIGGQNEDFISSKSDGFPTYHLASVVDDHLMGISHVFRGEEWSPSVSKHHQLYSAFGWTPPQFGHLPLLCNEDGTKSSKRSGDVDVAAYERAGYEPEALVNFLASMGWDHHAALEQSVDSSPYHVRQDQNSYFEVFSMPQSIQAFDSGLVNHRRAAVSRSKLDFSNKMTSRRKAGSMWDDPEFLATVGKDVGANEAKKAQETAKEERGQLIARFTEDSKASPEVKDSPRLNDAKFIENIFNIELPRATKLNEMAPKSAYFFKGPNYDDAEVGAFFAKSKATTYVEGLAQIMTTLSSPSSAWDMDSIDSVIKQTAKDSKSKKKSELMLSLRHASTGEKSGPMIAESMWTSGREETVRRLRAGRSWVVAKSRE